MTDVAPAKLSDTKVHVLNASGRGGQAADIAGALQDLGFAQPTAANDPIYAGTRLDCQGQIRFGTAGQATAAALWLVAPCTELYHDSRADDSVDLALGTDFTTLAHNDDIDAVLANLRPAPPSPQIPRCWPRSTPTAADRPAQSGIGSRPLNRCSAANSSSAIPGAAATTTNPAPPALGVDNNTRAPASAAINAPAAQSHTCTPCS